MSASLLLVTLGPVQEFIAQARRTRDLWYGSHLLSEVSRAAARSLAVGGAHLVFPALQAGDPELVPCPSARRQSGKPPLNVPNKLLAEVPDGGDPAGLARQARDEVLRFWREEVAARVRQDCAGLLDTGIDAVWDEQIDSFVEFAATWTPLDDYAAARRAAEQAIAARKLLRDFEPWRQVRGGQPKSSLDGARETVLRCSSRREPHLVRKYRIARGEELDAVGLVKRARGDPDQFAPIVNVALACWTELAAREAPEPMSALAAACAEIGMARVDRPDLPCARPFRFDASVLLPSRWKSVFEEQGLEEEGLEEQGLKGDPERWGRRHVRPLLDALSEPYPYVACLRADGDHMGRVLGDLRSAHEHREFSRALSAFATAARQSVEQDHRGSLVYAGGDDVLAFLPLPEALACADDLRRRFGDTMASACGDLTAQERPTLSVGLGVGHAMESMGDLLALGREAEEHAKRGGEGEPDRNALAVIVDKRSGGRRSWRAQWSDWAGDPVARLHADAELLQGRLSARKVYEVARTLARLPRPDAAAGSGWSRMLALDVRRCLARVDAGQGGLDPPAVGLTLDDDASYGGLHAAVSAWVRRLLVARTFVAAVPRLRAGREEAAG